MGTLACRLSGLSGLLGVILLAASFAVVAGPPPGADAAAVAAFAAAHRAQVLWGSWLQAVGPALILIFALALVHLAGAAGRLAGWLVFFGAAVLMTVNLLEVTFYIGALFPAPARTTSLALIAAVQHLYFFVAAPAVFLPLGWVLRGARVLPRIFAPLALLLGAGFVALGLVYAASLALPTPATAFAGVQALWWLAAALVLTVRGSAASRPVAAPAAR